MSRRVPSRRGRTRWLMIVPLSVLTLVILAMVGLEAIAPLGDPSDRAVAVPRLAIQEERPCLRLVEEDLPVGEIRDEFAPGGRVTSDQVYGCPAAFDGFEVSFAGEVVGDILYRRDGAWVQVNDDAYALRTGPLTDHRERSGANTGMSVWLPDGLHERIGEVGRADRRGDVILVRGTLLRTDPDDGAGLTIRAEELQVLAPSLEVRAPLHLVQAIVAAVLVVVAGITVAWSRRVSRR